MHKITDDQGRTCGPDWADTEPHRGSVVLTHGEHGTAWQRLFKDGVWHRVGGGRHHTWEWLLTQRNLVLVYDAPLRDGDVEQMRVLRGNETIRTVVNFDPPQPPPHADVTGMDLRVLREINRKKGTTS